MESFLSFNLQGIMQTVALIGTVFIAFGSMKTEIRHQGESLKHLDKRVDKMESAFIQLARQDERMNAMDQRMLSQGRRIDQIQVIHGRRKTQEEFEKDD